MIPIRVIAFFLFLILLAGALLTAGFVTDNMNYVYGCVGIVACMFLYICIYCTCKDHTKKELPIITTEQPQLIMGGMKKNKSDTDLELLQTV
jgi:peptidoglycan/LPS O-acetylase OafA/YrhL